MVVSLTNIKTSVNLTYNSLDITETEFDNFINDKAEFFEVFLNNRYDVKTELIDTIVELITINYLNKLQVSLEQGVILRNEYNTYETNTYLLLDQNIKDLLSTGAVIPDLPIPEETTNTNQ